MREVKTISRYGQNRVFVEVSKNMWSVHFDDAQLRYVGVSRNEDGSLYSFDPPGGPYISLKTNLKETVSRDLPNREIVSIESNEQGFFIINLKKENE